MEKYILVEWPYSQKYIGKKHCYFVDSEDLGSSTYFVREDIYELGESLPYEEFEERAE